MWMRERDSHRVCTLCGTCHGYLHVNERPGEYDWMKKKSVHKRNKWMEKKRLRERGVHWSKVGVIINDFNLTLGGTGGGCG